MCRLNDAKWEKRPSSNFNGFLGQAWRVFGEIVRWQSITSSEGCLQLARVLVFPDLVGGKGYYRRGGQATG